jgi:hypothetical protein
MGARSPRKRAHHAYQWGCSVHGKVKEVIMNYHVYRLVVTDGVKVWQAIAQTRFLNDAKNILTQWATGYVVHSDGAIIEATRDAFVEEKYMPFVH